MTGSCYTLLHDNSDYKSVYTLHPHFYVQSNI